MGYELNIKRRDENQKISKEEWSEYTRSAKSPDLAEH